MKGPFHVIARSGRGAPIIHGIGLSYYDYKVLERIFKKGGIDLSVVLYDPRTDMEYGPDGIGKPRIRKNNEI